MKSTKELLEKVERRLLWGALLFIVLVLFSLILEWGLTN